MFQAEMPEIKELKSPVEEKSSSVVMMEKMESRLDADDASNGETIGARRKTATKRQVSMNK